MIINIFIAADERDKSRGDFFKKCKTDVLEHINDEKCVIKIFHIDSEKCNEAYIELNMDCHKDSPFLFLTYMHGDQNSIIANKSQFIRVGGNNVLFKSTLFYSVTCYSGLNLGPDLIRNGCSTFIGYDKEVFTFVDEDETISIRCLNWGIHYFLSKEDSTILEAFNSMKKEYDSQINRLIRNNDLIKASFLLNNREALVIHGNLNLTKTDLVCNE